MCIIVLLSIFPFSFTISDQDLKEKHRTQKYEPISVEAREHLKKVMAVEYEFYYFIKYRFFMQYRSIKAIVNTEKQQNSLCKFWHLFHC